MQHSTSLEFAMPKLCSDCERNTALIQTRDGHAFCQTCIEYWKALGARDQLGELAQDETQDRDGTQDKTAAVYNSVQQITQRPSFRHLRLVSNC